MTQTSDSRNSRRTTQGIVVSAQMDKTITVRVERMFKHPKYQKFIRRHSKVHAHDENREANVGDTVEVMETRPISKTKRFRLIKVLERTALPAGGEQ